MGLKILSLNSKIKKLILLLFFLITSLISNLKVYPQVRISEKVDIIPKILNQMEQNSVVETHILKAIVEWDTTGGTTRWLRAKMKLINGCTGALIESDYAYDGYIELELSTDLAARFGVNVYTESNNYPIDNSWFPSGFAYNVKIYADGILVEETSNSTSVVPWRSHIGLRIGSYMANEYDDALCYDEGVPLYIDDTECEPAYWNALSNSVSVSIIEGAEFTSFYSYYGDELLGDNLTFTTDIHGNYYTEVGTVHLKYDEEYSESTEPKEVILEASVSGLNARDSIIIYPSSTIFKVAGEIQDYTESIIRWERITINAWLESSGYCEGIVEPPENATFTAEVIQGSRFGGLVNPVTGKTSVKISGLNTINGQLSIIYFADGEIVEKSEEILIKITSSILDSEPKIISFLVKPPGLFITAEPEEISLDEVANLKVYWVNELGSLVLMPADQPLQVSILEGEEYGALHNILDDEYEDSFDEIYQEFNFKSESEIDPDTAYVLIKVSTLVFWGGFFGKIEKDGQDNPIQTKTLKNASEQISISNNKIVDKKLLLGTPSKSQKSLWAYEIYGIAKVKINNNFLDHFEVRIIPDTISARDTIAFTECARIFVQAKDIDSNDVIIDNNTIIKLRVTSNPNYGTFISATGDTVSNTPAVLENVKYEDAYNGRIKFAAIKDNPDSVVSCNIKVSLVEDTSKCVDQQVIVLEQTLKIVMNGNREVRPNVSDIVNLSEATLQNLENYRKPFFVSFTRGGHQIAGHQFRISTDYLNGSGGHDHIDFRRPSTPENIKYWNYGHFRKSDSSMVLANPLIDNSRTNCFEYEYNYISTRWGDIIKLILISNHNKLLSDTLNLTERIPDLIVLEPGLSYSLIGGTNSHTGPPMTDQEDHNHWGTNSTITSIQNIARRWNEIHQNSIIAINDISLPYGGRFDIFGRWTGSHDTHREGNDVDIRSSTITTTDEVDYYIDNNRNGVYDIGDTEIDNTGQIPLENYRFIDDRVQEFRDICIRERVVPVLEYPNNVDGDEHFHLNF